jgi:large subunit ribosomal protein L30
MAKGGKTIKVKLVSSALRRESSQSDTLRGLGLRRVGHQVEVEDTPAVRGMVRKIAHLVEVSE